MTSANQARMLTFADFITSSSTNGTTTTAFTRNRHPHNPTFNLSSHQNPTFLSFLNPQVISIVGPLPLTLAQNQTRTQTQTRIHNSDYIDFNNQYLFYQILRRIAIQEGQIWRKMIRTANSFIYSLSNKPKCKPKNVEPDPCSVCREEFVSSSLISKLPCKHLFHYECIVPWLYKNYVCPMCRFELPKETVSGSLMRYIVGVGDKCVEGWGVDKESGFWDAVSRNDLELPVYPSWFLGPMSWAKSGSKSIMMGRAEMGSIGPERVGEVGNNGVTIDKDGDTIMTNVGINGVTIDKDGDTIMTNVEN